MTETTPRGTSSRRWLWFVSPIAVGVVVFLVTNITQGACFDSTDPAATYCDSGPMVGVAGTWVLWGAWALFTAVCVARAVGRRR